MESKRIITDFRSAPFFGLLPGAKELEDGKWKDLDLNFVLENRPEVSMVKDGRVFVADRSNPFLSPWDIVKFEGMVESQDAKNGLACFAFGYWIARWAKWAVVVCNLETKSVTVLPPLFDEGIWTHKLGLWTVALWVDNGNYKVIAAFGAMDDGNQIPVFVYDSVAGNWAKVGENNEHRFLKSLVVRGNLCYGLERRTMDYGLADPELVALDLNKVEDGFQRLSILAGDAWSLVECKGQLWMVSYVGKNEGKSEYLIQELQLGPENDVTCKDIGKFMPPASYCLEDCKGVGDKLYIGARGNGYVLMEWFEGKTSIVMTSDHSWQILN